VTGVGTAAYGNTTVGYDSLGRVGSVREPAGAETPESLLTFTYATPTMASGTSGGDYASRLKEITAPAVRLSPHTRVLLRCLSHAKRALSAIWPLCTSAGDAR
jgi:hypothetical protein